MGSRTFQGSGACHRRAIECVLSRLAACALLGVLAGVGNAYADERSMEGESTAEARETEAADSSAPAETEGRIGRTWWWAER